jgi:hypothetical protein
MTQLREGASRLAAACTSALSVSRSGIAAGDNAAMASPFFAAYFPISRSALRQEQNRN